MNRRLLLSCVLSFLGLHFFATLNIASAADPNEFIDYSVTGVPGRLFVPPEAMLSGEARPLVLFLHGAGEIGSNNVAQVGGNIDNLFEAAKDVGAFLYAPQAINFGFTTTARTNTIMNQIDQAIGEYNIDTNRIYVTGLSMGGGGTWNMLNRFPDRFASGVPIAGVAPTGDFQATNLVGLPVWAHHARNDTVVTRLRSQQVVNSILSAAGEPRLSFPPSSDSTTTVEFMNDELDLRYTETPFGGHGIWHAVYGDQQVRDWMFSQSLIPEPSAMVLLLGCCSLLTWNRKRHVLDLDR